MHMSMSSVILYPAPPPPKPGEQRAAAIVCTNPCRVAVNWGIVTIMNTTDIIATQIEEGWLSAG